MTTKGRVFLLDDDDLIVSMLSVVLKDEGYEVVGETEPEEIVDKIRSFAPDVVLLDVKLPGRSGLDILKELMEQGVGASVVMLTSDDSVETAVKAMKMGAVDYVTKPFDMDMTMLVVASIMEKRNLKQDVEYLHKVCSPLTSTEPVGSSKAIREVKERAEKLARAGVSMVLITGENGTGKEVFARYIYNLMQDRDSGECSPFIGINCSALPETLIESELFGHDKGAFTDAKAEKKGVFELASGGAILLDEIGEMKWNLQAKLLRVLEERMIRRVGGRHDIPINATVFATTNRDLLEAVIGGEFRSDLYYRLSAFSLHIPPLRERKEDILPLAEHFLELYRGKYCKTTLSALTPEAQKLLLAYRWPGNVRELRNVIEQIVALESGDAIFPVHLPKEILCPVGNGSMHASSTEVAIPDTGLSLDGVEQILILGALQKAGNNKMQAAKILGITYGSLRYQIKKFGLE